MAVSSPAHPSGYIEEHRCQNYCRAYDCDTLPYRATILTRQSQPEDDVTAAAAQKREASDYESDAPVFQFVIWL